jgi:N-acetylmuramoyl-L-alanine amidase
MTRNSDAYLTLEERTAIANTKNADLFISLHANDSKNINTYGIETYVLNLATDNSEITVAARENATSTKNISDLQTILTDIMQNTKIDESSLLASYIQDSSCNYLTPKYTHIKNRGVKKAPFYVLLGARMPAILIEASFISNPRECKRLTRARYQEHLCEGILDGIQKYVEKSRMAS